MAALEYILQSGHFISIISQALLFFPFRFTISLLVRQRSQLPGKGKKGTGSPACIMEKVINITFHLTTTPGIV
jgi:hypothetical protein